MEPEDTVENTLIELWYFKDSGKYYTTGHLSVPCDMPFNLVIEKVRECKSSSSLPGLVKGHSEFSVVITGNGHESGWPVLLK